MTDSGDLSDCSSLEEGATHRLRSEHPCSSGPPKKTTIMIFIILIEVSFSNSSSFSSSLASESSFGGGLCYPQVGAFPKVLSFIILVVIFLIILLRDSRSNKLPALSRQNYPIYLFSQYSGLTLIKSYKR